MTHAYVIHIIGQPLFMVRSWADAKSAIHGVKNSYCKKFRSEKDAHSYIVASNVWEKDANVEKDALTVNSDIVYTDGAARDGIAVYAIYFGSDDDDRNQYGLVPATWNQTAPAAELWAVLQAARMANQKATILSDSSYAVNASTNANSVEWKANREMIDEVHTLIKWKRIRIHKVPAHQGIKGNEIANSMCAFALNHCGISTPDAKGCLQ